METDNRKNSDENITKLRSDGQIVIDTGNKAQASA